MITSYTFDVSDTKNLYMGFTTEMYVLLHPIISARINEAVRLAKEYDCVRPAIRLEKFLKSPFRGDSIDTYYFHTPFVGNILSTNSPIRILYEGFTLEVCPGYEIYQHLFFGHTLSSIFRSHTSYHKASNTFIKITPRSFIKLLTFALNQGLNPNSVVYYPSGRKAILSPNEITRLAYAKHKGLDLDLVIFQGVSSKKRGVLQYYQIVRLALAKDKGLDPDSAIYYLQGHDNVLSSDEITRLALAKDKGLDPDSVIHRLTSYDGETIYVSVLSSDEITNLALAKNKGLDLNLVIHRLTIDGETTCVSVLSSDEITRLALAKDKGLDPNLVMYTTHWGIKKTVLSFDEITRLALAKDKGLDPNLVMYTTHYCREKKVLSFDEITSLAEKISSIQAFFDTNLPPSMLVTFAMSFSSDAYLPQAMTDDEARELIVSMSKESQNYADFIAAHWKWSPIELSGVVASFFHPRGEEQPAEVYSSTSCPVSPKAKSLRV